MRVNLTIHLTRDDRMLIAEQFGDDAPARHIDCHEFAMRSIRLRLDDLAETKRSPAAPSTETPHAN